MSQRTAIEWTDTTWNPVTGCTQVSAGCDNCYALSMANRLLASNYTRRTPEVDTKINRNDPFAVRTWQDRLNEPLAWKNPRRVFVNSMGDLFHKDVPEDFVRSVFRVMSTASQHTFQILTKRPARLARFIQRNPQLSVGGKIPAHIWLGTSVEHQSVVFRVRQLTQVCARVRFLSCEPLLGPLDFSLTGINWVIAGGESGGHHRPIDLNWVRQLRDKCTDAGVPFFFKQVGGRTPKTGGRLLDGRTWDEFPPPSTS